MAFEAPPVTLVNAILQGAMLGGLYAMFATGLSLLFGVMRLVNLAHGDFIVLAAFIGLVVANVLHVHPFVSLLAVVPIMFAFGYCLQRGLVNRSLGADVLPPLLVTFGLSVITQNALLEVFTADMRKLAAGQLETMSLQLPGGLAVGVLPLLMLATGIAIIAALQLFLYRSEFGRAFRATSDDREAAQLMGIDPAHIFALAMAIALAVGSVAAIFLAMRTGFDPSAGPARLLFAFETVIIGGLGNLWGTLAGGIILGVAQSIGAEIDPGYQILAGHLAFLAVVLVRPQGLFPKVP
jgi:branched-chain amino acid transport system permease protein